MTAQRELSKAQRAAKPGTDSVPVTRLAMWQDIYKTASLNGSKSAMAQAKTMIARLDGELPAATTPKTPKASGKKGSGENG